MKAQLADGTVVFIRFEYWAEKEYAHVTGDSCGRRWLRETVEERIPSKATRITFCTISNEAGQDIVVAGAFFSPDPLMPYDKVYGREIALHKAASKLDRDDNGVILSAYYSRPHKATNYHRPKHYPHPAQVVAHRVEVIEEEFAQEVATFD